MCGVERFELAGEEKILLDLTEGGEPGWRRGG